jgi:methionyl-tRNA formyltransferase
MKALFLGARSYQTAAAISAWLGEGHEIVEFWYPQTDRGRHDRALRFLAPQWSVSALLAHHRIPSTVVPPLTRWEGVAGAAAKTAADVVISVYFGYIVPTSMLDQFVDRIVNVHPSLLPRYRGPHPTLGMLTDPAANGSSGVTLHVMTEGLDEGPIIGQKPVPFPADADMMGFRIRVAQAGADMMRMVPAYIGRGIIPVAQNEAASSYCKIDFDRDLVLGPHRTIQEVSWLCRTVPPLWPLRVAAAGKTRVRAPVRVLGAATGQPTIIRALWVEFDAADGRVMVRRQTPLWRKLEQFRFFLLLRRAPTRSSLAA